MIDYQLDTDLQTMAPGDSLLTNVRLSWSIPKGSWWADPTFGHRFRELTKALPRYEALAVEYARQALQWLLNNGRLTAIDLTAMADRERNRMVLTGTLTAANGSQIPFEYFVEVA